MNDKRTLHPRPQQAGFIRRHFMWCSRCGSPKWMECPAGLSAEEQFSAWKENGEPCDCGVGWNDDEPNKVLASRSPPGWYIRKAAGFTDTPADIEAYWLGTIRTQLQHALDQADNARYECESLHKLEGLNAIDRELSMLYKRLSDLITERQHQEQS